MASCFGSDRWSARRAAQARRDGLRPARHRDDLKPSSARQGQSRKSCGSMASTGSAAGSPGWYAAFSTPVDGSVNRRRQPCSTTSAPSKSRPSRPMVTSAPSQVLQAPDAIRRASSSAVRSVCRRRGSFVSDLAGATTIVRRVYPAALSRSMYHCPVKSKLLS